MSKAVAEWADGDSVAAAVAYGAKYFCTKDIGRSAGGHSILSEENRNWAEARFGIEFVTLDELSQAIA